jgi:hypothetical protein
MNLPILFNENTAVERRTRQRTQCSNAQLALTRGRLLLAIDHGDLDRRRGQASHIIEQSLDPLFPARLQIQKRRLRPASARKALREILVTRGTAAPTAFLPALDLERLAVSTRRPRVDARCRSRCPNSPEGAGVRSPSTEPRSSSS